MSVFDRVKAAWPSPFRINAAGAPAPMRHDAFWSGLEAAASAIFSITTSFVVARIVGPAEFGAGTAVTAVYVVLWVSINALFADALVQRESIEDSTASSAFWAACCAGLLAMVLQSAAGGALAVTFHDHRLVPMALVLAVPLPMVAGGSTIQGRLIRERAYRHLAVRTLTGQGLGTVVGVLAALDGAGAWAIVAQHAVSSSSGALILLLGRNWRPQWYMDRVAVRALLAVGLPLMGSTLVSIARYRLFAVLIGGTAGATVLGQVHIAFRLVETVRELTFVALWRLMLPVFSKDQNDRRLMLRQVDRWLPRCVAVTFPLCAVLGFGLAPIVGLAMGPAWAAASEATLPLVGLMAWSCMLFPSGVALVALGLTRFTLYANVASLVCIAAGVLLVRPTTPWQAVTIWVVGQVLVSPYSLWANGRALRVGMLRPLSGGWTARGRR